MYSKEEKMIQGVKNYSTQKKRAILWCLKLVAQADGNVTDSELVEIMNQNLHVLNLTNSEIESMGKLKPEEFVKTLNSMTQDELFILGFMMGRVANSDGKVHETEIEWIYKLLKAGNLNFETITGILIGITGLQHK